MSLPDDVAALIVESLAARQRLRQASIARAELAIVRNARAALVALRAALALDPTRSLPIWRGLPPRDIVALSDGLIRLYEQIDAEGIAEGI